MRTVSLRVGLAAFAFCSAAVSHAGIAYSNLAPGYTWNTSVGWTISGSAVSPGAQTVAHQFTSAVSGSLDNVVVVLGSLGGTNLGAVYLYEDSGSDTVGAYMCSWSFNPLPSFYTGSGMTTLTNSYPAITMSSGSKYWIRCDVLATDSNNAWNINNTGAVGLSAVSHDGWSTWFYDNLDQGAFEVNVVPEPAALSILGMGALALFRRRR